MLGFRLQQLHLPSLDRYLIPLPKLGEQQARALEEDLEGRGFAVRAQRSRVNASKGPLRVSIETRLGLAASSNDMLDALGPSIPSIKSQAEPTRDVSSLYFTLKRSSGLTVLKFFPRMESSRTWTCLRRDGLSGLTPDEGEVLRRLLSMLPPSSTIDCVTSTPREGSKAIQAGRRQYFESRIEVSAFLASLRTMDSDPSNSAYLPRSSILRLRGLLDHPVVPARELGEWCCAV